MRILHLLSQTELTGAEVYARELISYQKSQGHDVFVISDKIHVDLPIPWISRPLSTRFLNQRLLNILFIRGLLKKKTIDVIHCHSRGAVRHASPARRGLKVAMVTTIHGKQHNSVSKRFLDSYGDFKILICENLIPQMVDQFHINPRTLQVLRNPFQVENFEFSASLPPKTRLAFVGRSSGPKGDRFKELFQKTLFPWLQKNPDVEFDIIASRPERFGEDFLRQAKTLGSRVHILGEVQNLKTHLQTYTGVLAAGRVAVECLLSGVSVIGFGEAQTEGLITCENFDLAVKSNFGDIAAAQVQDIDGSSVRDAAELLHHQPPQAEVRRQLRQQTATAFGTGSIQERIIDIYQAARFQRFVPKAVPILMYHKIPNQNLPTKHRIFVTKDRFERHLQFFKKRNFSLLTFKDLSDFWHGQKPLFTFPRRPLLVTFDDGYKDNFENAWPLLKKYQFRATIFLLSDSRITENTWDEVEPGNPQTLLSLEEKKQMLKSGIFELGSHGVDHQSLPRLSSAQILKQMIQSKQDLEATFATEVVAFAYPFGHIDDRLPALARQAGYQFAVNTDQGVFHLSENPHSLFRVNVMPEDGLLQIWKKTSSWYRKYYYFKRGK